MARRVERIAITVYAERDENGNIIKRLSSVNFTTYDPNPALDAKAIDSAPFNGKAPPPVYDGDMTLDQLLQTSVNIAKDQGRAT
jgi:hypothetical protein